MILSKNRKTDRFASFTFDDGLINSAYKANDIIFPNKATFYVVSGWLRPNPVKIIDKCNIGLNHGSLREWKRLSDKGHEIGSHTVSHAGPNGDWPDGYLKSLEFIKNFGSGPYSLAMPFGIKSPNVLPYDSIRLCNGEKIFNSLENIDFSGLLSFDPFEDGLIIEDAEKRIYDLPSYSWLIIRAHGLDNEGYCPWPSPYFKKIYEILLAESFNIMTVREMTQKFFH